MRLILILVTGIVGIGSAFAEQNESTSQTRASEKNSDTVDYFDGRGQLIGSVTKIGGVTYFIGPDGSQLGTAETVEGHRVFKSY